MARCGACGGWTTREQPMGTRCEACDGSLGQEAFRRCVSPAAYRTDFRPAKIGEEELRVVRSRIVCAEASPVRPIPVRGTNLAMSLERSSNVLRLNPGQASEPLDSEGYAFAHGDERCATGGLTVKLANRVEGGVDRSLPRLDAVALAGGGNPQQQLDTPEGPWSGRAAS